MGQARRNRLAGIQPRPWIAQAEAFRIVGIPNKAHDTDNTKIAQLYGDEQIVTFTDKTCIDCGGRVTMFMVPDKVWDKLGYKLDEYACLSCVTRRLNPAISDDADDDIEDRLAEEIALQRDRFDFKPINNYGGCPQRCQTVAIFFYSNYDSMPASKVGGRSWVRDGAA